MKQCFKKAGIVLCIMVLCSMAVAAAPIANDFVRHTPQNTVLPFSADDFYGVTVTFDDQPLTGVKFTSLPGWFGGGKLLLSGKKVKTNQEISVEDLDKLAFQPRKNYTGKVDIACKLICGREYSQEAILTVLVSGESTQPTAALADKSIVVDKNCPERFSVVDGVFSLGEKSIKITDKPQNGRVDIANRKSGEVIYTPRAGYEGVDYFSVCVQDIYGRKSLATVCVLVTDNTPAYADPLPKTA